MNNPAQSSLSHTLFAKLWYTQTGQARVPAVFAVHICLRGGAVIDMDGQSRSIVGSAALKTDRITLNCALHWSMIAHPW